jgi:hypothetical protein
MVAVAAVAAVVAEAATAKVRASLHRKVSSRRNPNRLRRSSRLHPKASLRRDNRRHLRDKRLRVNHLLLRDSRRVSNRPRRHRVSRPRVSNRRHLKVSRNHRAPTRTRSKGSRRRGSLRPLPASRHSRGK